MRLMSLLFLCLTFLAGVTVGTVEIALVNIVVFLALALALAAEHFIAPRFGKNGLVYGMAGAFFVSCLWPAVIHALRDDPYCAGDECPPKEPQVTVTLSPVR